MKFLCLLLVSLLVACTVVVINGQENEVNVHKNFDRKIKVDIDDNEQAERGDLLNIPAPK